jgi:hypothetical protein
MQSDETCVPTVPGAWYRKCDTPCRRDTWRGRQARADRAPTSQKSSSANGSFGPACTGRVGLQTTAERAGPASLADGVIVIDNAAEKSASIIAPRGHCYSPAATTSGGNLGNIFGRQVVSVIERCLTIRSVPIMDQQRDREQLETMLEQCRRLSGAASDPATSIRLAKLIEELEHSLREAVYSPE